MVQVQFGQKDIFSKTVLIYLETKSLFPSPLGHHMSHFNAPFTHIPPSSHTCTATKSRTPIQWMIAISFSARPCSLHRRTSPLHRTTPGDTGLLSTVSNCFFLVFSPVFHTPSASTSSHLVGITKKACSNFRRNLFNSFSYCR